MILDTIMQNRTEIRVIGKRGGEDDANYKTKSGKYVIAFVTLYTRIIRFLCITLKY